MVPALRKQYNEHFTKEKYDAFIKDLSNIFPDQLEFRIAETPIYIPTSFTQKMLNACESIIDVITTPAYQKQSERAIPDHLKVPNEDAHPHFIAFDFGICQNEKGELEPQLIEMQGFPTLFTWQVLLPEMHEKHFGKPDNYSIYLNEFNRESYTDLLRKIIVAEAKPENVILLEIFPEQQKTRVDFFATEQFLGIKTVCLTKLIQEGKDLFYMRDGQKTKVERIYNRLIFDDLFQQPKEVQEKGRIFQQELNVTWVPHPNWFYRLSKYTLPFIDHPYVPETKFLNTVTTLPADLENYVVKPLFSFAGQGVIIDVTKEQMEQIPDPENWILQRKVQYANVIETPDEPAKAEIRLFYFWEPGAPRPIATCNLARLSKGKMVGVRYNKDKEWVGGTFSLFEQ
ncbi:hypothetical protein [Flavisolibacter tropicus]|uniref:Glutathionylspermidine synthase pre-ATP-grasp-like domain-containing protein n=1 Tax=Flavisolibacter tropicus TaxID=1492898 RepID=A0A172U0X5_9BACT|nr:hypothetical protein [Flavisolibacter tropicus]ANE52872.1 hypothetical protein SY85_22710 [Flavisolibacter tropicus]